MVSAHVRCCGQAGAHLEGYGKSSVSDWRSGGRVTPSVPVALPRRATYMGIILLPNHLHRVTFDKGCKAR